MSETSEEKITSRDSSNRATLSGHPDSLLAAALDPASASQPHVVRRDLDGHYFFDRNPGVFALVLEYLRTGKAFDCAAFGVTREQILEEAEFFALRQLVEAYSVKRVLLAYCSFGDLMNPGHRVFMHK